MRRALRVAALACLLPQAWGGANEWGCQNAFFTALDFLVDASAKRVVPATLVCARERGWFRPPRVWNGVATWGWHDAGACVNLLGEALQRYSNAFSQISSMVAICTDVDPVTKLQAGTSQSIFAAARSFFIVAADMGTASEVCDDTYIQGYGGIYCWIQITDSIFNLCKAAKFIDTALDNTDGLTMIQEAEEAANGGAPEPIADSSGAPAPEADDSGAPAPEADDSGAPAPEADDSGAPVPVSDDAGAPAPTPAPTQPPTLGVDLSGDIISSSGGPIERRRRLTAEQRLLGSADYNVKLPPHVLKIGQELLRAFNKTSFEPLLGDRKARQEQIAAEMRRDGKQAVFARALSELQSAFARLPAGPPIVA